MATRRNISLALVVLLALFVSACNLIAGGQSEEQIAQTATAAMATQPTRTPLSTSGIPTTFPVNQPTSLPTFLFPTAVVNFPTSVPPVIFPTAVPPQVFPTNTQLPVSIVILSPVPGNIVAGNVQILGSAIHPQFLQYQVEFGPDPNPGNLWFPATSAVTTPVLNGLLGIWNTNGVQDSKYQLRLRVYLRDGTLLTTVVGNITVQNHVSTPIPSPTPNIPRPIAAFTQDKPSGDVPLTVQFTNQSSGTISVVQWNFGDGSSSGDVNPKHTFNSPGLFNVTLIVAGPGGTSNVSRQINVSSPTAPVAGFTQDRTSGLAPLTVQFSDQSSGNVTSYLWNFSDGSTSAVRNPAHTFTIPGTYNVFLTVTGPGGSSSVTRQITVTSAIPPTATLTNTFTPTFTNTFTLTPSNTPTGTITPQPPTATFTSTFTPTNTDTPVPPTLTFTPSDTPTGTITPLPPTATFTSTFTPTNTDTPVPPTFTPTNTDTSVPPTFTPTNTDTPVPPTLTPTNTDTPIPPTATNTEIPAPQASFAASVVPNNPLAIQLTDQSTGQITGWSWNFGDNTTSTEQNPQHVYAAGGTYTITLTVTDSQGRTSQFAGTISLTAPVQAAFTPAVSGLTVQFTDQSTGTIASRSWDFGDGQTSTEQNPQHTYANANNGNPYTVTLTVTGTDGSTNGTQQQVTLAEPVQAQFSAQPSSLTVQFTDQSTGSVASRTWDFGDGQTSTEQNPQHTYANANNGTPYTVTLTVTGTDGSSNAIQKPVTVSAPVQAAFSAQPNGLAVQFVDQSTGTIAGWAWDFGDGQTSTEQNPQHTYADANGSPYTVTLTVTGTDGSTNGIQQQVPVSAPVQAAFSAQANGLNVQFTDQSTGSIASRMWDFGDGQTSTEQNPQHTYADASGNPYTVTLTVVGTDGSTNGVQQRVPVSAPVQAGFTAQPTDLNVQFTDTSTGSPVSWAWDFGDGQTSTEQNPLHTYASDNSGNPYTVTLTVTGSDGSSNAIQQPVTISAPAQPTQPPQQSIVDTTPILPDFNALHDLLRGIYTNGVNSNGANAHVFAEAGDVSILPQTGILTPFAPGGQYNLNNHNELQAGIDWFNGADLGGGVTSFSRQSLAVNPGLVAQDLLDPTKSVPQCNGEAPLACELHQIHPVLMFVAVGSNDAHNGTDPGAFQNTLNQIVATITSNGTIPVLMTIPDDGTNPNVLAINTAIITVAQQNNVPLLNAARALNELNGGFNMNTAQNGPGALGNNAVNNNGINALNLDLLQVLNDARNIIFPDAS